MICSSKITWKDDKIGLQSNTGRKKGSKDFRSGWRENELHSSPAFEGAAYTTAGFPEARSLSAWKVAAGWVLYPTGALGMPKPTFKIHAHT